MRKGGTHHALKGIVIASQVDAQGGGQLVLGTAIVTLPEHCTRDWQATAEKYLVQSLLHGQVWLVNCIHAEGEKTRQT